jgi:ABC-2 type transport system ATP-binding protein
VPKGICYGLLGPNGAGKTTAISIITGTLDADSGTVTLDGESVSTNNLRIKKRIGFVPQDLALYEELNSVDNLRFFGALYGLFGDELEKRVEFGLEVAGLADRRRGAVRDFSGGMKRRLNIASALLHNPDFIVLDEPTVGVDPQSRNLIFEALEALLAEGKTLLYTTHYMEEAERLCQRLAIMDNGKIIAEGSREDLHKLVPTKAVITVEAAEGTTVPPNIPGACNTLVEGHRVTFELEDLKSGLIPALASFAAIEQVHTEQATLEQVFLHLTGRSLRD